MTLSRFLKHYVYIPLGGNVKGKNPALHKLDGDNVGWWFMAWCQLDICRVGWFAWHVPCYKPRVA